MRFIMRRFLFSFVLVTVSLVCTAQSWDIDALKKVNGIKSGFVRGFSDGVSKTEPFIALGIPVAMGTYALLDNNNKLMSDAVYIGTSVAEALAVTYIAKCAVDRERPFTHYPDLIDNRENPSSSSFPSAHTASAFSLATSLSIRYPKWYIIVPSYSWACSVGFARMNVGVHYPSDVIAGAVIGAGCAVVNVYVNKWLKQSVFPKVTPKLLLY